MNVILYAEFSDWLIEIRTANNMSWYWILWFQKPTVVLNYSLLLQTLSNQLRNLFKRVTAALEHKGNWRNTDGF